MRFSGLFTVAALCVLLAACGTSDYQKPIQTFSDATELTRQSLHGYTDALVAQVRDGRMQEALESPRSVKYEQGGCLVSSKRCRIVLQGEGEEPKQLSPDEPIPKILALMDAIAAYADGLNAIATSDSAGKAEASLASVDGSLQQLASLAGQQGQALQGYAAPAAAAAGWIFGEYIDSVRYRALQDATKRADPVIGDAVRVLQDVAKEVNIANRAALAETVSKRKDAFRAAESESSLESLLAAAAAYDAALTAAPSGVFEKLRESHAELTKALNTEGISFAAAFAKMESLKAEAEKLKKIVSAFVAASKKG